ncbi:MAG: resolvase [Bacillota bacterium]
MILAIDPGRDKSGLAVVTDDNQIIEQMVIGTRELKDIIFTFGKEYNITEVVLGDGTASGGVKELVSDYHWDVKMVDETNSTLEARELYWADNPPRGWRKLIPTALQTPRRAIDDYAAIVLARRY